MPLILDISAAAILVLLIVVVLLFCACEFDYRPRHPSGTLLEHSERITEEDIPPSVAEQRALKTLYVNKQRNPMPGDALASLGVRLSGLARP